MTDNLSRNKYNEEGLVHYNDIVEPGVYLPTRWPDEPCTMDHSDCIWNKYRLLVLQLGTIDEAQRLIPAKIWCNNSPDTAEGVGTHLFGAPDNEPRGPGFADILYRKAEHLEGAVIFKLKDS